MMSDEYVYYLENHYGLEEHEVLLSVRNYVSNENIKILSKFLKDFDINIYAIPSTNGGVKDWIKIVVKITKKEANTIIAIASITTAIASIPIALITCISFLQSNPNLDKAKQILEIELLAKNLGYDEIPQSILNILDDEEIKVYKSNRYKKMLEESKIEYYEDVIYDTNKKEIGRTEKINRNKFSQFVKEKENTTEIVTEVAKIIITKVTTIKESKGNWAGILHNNYISFQIKDRDFLNDFLEGHYPIKDKADDDYMVVKLVYEKNLVNGKISNIEVQTVYQFNDKTIKTNLENISIKNSTEMTLFDSSKENKDTPQ